MKGLAAFLPYMLASVYLRALQRSGWYLSSFFWSSRPIKRRRKVFKRILLKKNNLINFRYFQTGQITPLSTKSSTDLRTLRRSKPLTVPGISFAKRAVFGSAFSCFAFSCTLKYRYMITS